MQLLGLVIGAASVLFVSTSKADGLFSSAANCCRKLEQSAGLRDKVFFPRSATYRARIDSYWSLSAALEPWCMVLPSTAEDVSTTIKTLVAERCPFGIRGGGHGSFPLSNSVKHGVTIDFGYMKKTTYNKDTKLASIQPGSNWQSVFDDLAPHGVAVAGGRVGTVGISGFLTGGGFSFHAASHGMACDNVVNYEIVLSSGAIVNANATSDPDLWHAMKGGSGNLGIVTRFDMESIPYSDPAKPAIWGGNLEFSTNSASNLIGAMVDFTDNVDKDEDSSVILTWTYAPQTGSGTVINTAVYNTKGKIKPPAFDGFYAAPGLSSDITKVDTLATHVRELGYGQVAGSHYIWFVSAFKNDPRPMKFATDKFMQLNAAMEKLAPSKESKLNSNCFLQPITKSIVKNGKTRGGNILGMDKLTDENGNGILFLVTVSVNSDAAKDRILSKVEKYVAEVDAYADSLGLRWNWRYLNYARGSQEVISTYGKENVKKLQAASKKYDAKQVFQELRRSGFKIPQSFDRKEL